MNDKQLELVNGFDLFVRREFFDQDTCKKLVAEMQLAKRMPATVYGSSLSGSVNENVRRTVRCTLSQRTVDYVMSRLLDYKPEVEKHFRITLSECEEPQFLRYRIGDFFVAHQDGNTGLLQLATEARRVSLVIFLNQQSDTAQEGAYCGGSLVFHDWRIGASAPPFHMTAEAGTLVAFRSETTHEVTQVTHGERLSIACWYR